MTIRNPTTTIDERFGDPAASPTPWAAAVAELEKAQVYWLTTVRAAGRPHTATVAGIFMDETFYFSSGPGEQKARNLQHHREVTVTTGCNGFEGLDVVIEGTAVQVGDMDLLQRLAAAYEAKYDIFHFVPENGVFGGERNTSLVFRVDAHTAFGFHKGAPFSQTRWRF